MEAILKLFAAVLVGGIIGSEREFRHGLGLRTLMLVCLGAAMFTIYSDEFAQDQGDPRRIAAAVVTGVGFLGAGVILREKGRIIGLTTAASIWTVAALGMGIGLGLYGFVAVGTVLIVVILWGVPRLMDHINTGKTVTYRASFPVDETKLDSLNALFQESGLAIHDVLIKKQGGKMTCIWQVHGLMKEHEQVIQHFILDPEVTDFQIA